MISLVFSSQEGFTGRLKRKQWYGHILSIIRAGIKAWIPQDIAIVFLEEQAMRKINRKYHHTDRVTDVLSFQYPGVQNAAGEGELYLCVPQIARQAKRHHQPFLREYMNVLVHGFLHLQGYDHRKPQERKRMHALTAKFVSQAKKKKLW